MSVQNQFFKYMCKTQVSTHVVLPVNIFVCVIFAKLHAIWARNHKCGLWQKVDLWFKNHEHTISENQSNDNETRTQQ